MLKKNINRKNLADKIYQNIGFAKVISRNLVDDIFDIIISNIKSNKKIKITSFGTFIKKKKKRKNGKKSKNQRKENDI